MDQREILRGQLEQDPPLSEEKREALEELIAKFVEYIVSFRQHSDFHEQCVERIFLDLQRLLKPEKLTVYAPSTMRESSQRSSSGRGCS